MTTINNNIRPASYSSPTSALSSIESLLQSPELAPLKSLLSSLLGGASSFGGAAQTSGAGASAGTLPSPEGRVSGAGADIAGPGLAQAGSVFQQGMSAVSGAGATGGAEIPQASYATGDKVKDDYMNSLDPQMKKQVEYQEKVQKMTEAFTLISNILKMLHDAAQAWAGNLK